MAMALLAVRAVTADPTSDRPTRAATRLRAEAGGGDGARVHPSRGRAALQAVPTPPGRGGLAPVDDGRWQTGDRLAEALHRRRPHPQRPEAVSIQLERQLAFLTNWLASFRPYIATEIIDYIHAHHDDDL
jgi:hypothetical protein